MRTANLIKTQNLYTIYARQRMLLKRNERKQNRPNKFRRAGYSGKKVKHINKNRMEKEREKRLVFLSPTRMNPLTK